MKGAKLFKMDEETDKKNSKVMRIGLDMCELIIRVKKKFKDEYGFEPNPVEVTNIIAKRVNDNELF